MADRIETATVTVPSGTTIAAPQITALVLRDAIMERVEVVIPPGPSGLVGFAMAHSGQQVIPFRAGNWIVGDDEKWSADLDGFPTGDLWSVMAYNLDIYAHTLYLRLYLREIAPPRPAPLVPLAIVAQGDASHVA